MRSDILTYLNANLVTGFGVSEELPWDASGQPLYLKNMKRYMWIAHRQSKNP